MNYANPDKSRRLLKVLGVLADRKEHSTLAIINRARVCAVSAAVSELRAAGHKIKCQRRGTKWYYRMAA